ncbi:MAG: type II toxin-antitoxin system VapC family toxin [Thermoanaerobaculia bacterium]
MTLTFVDAGVLIAAARGTDLIAIRANQALGDPRRSFAASSFLRLEVLPKAVFHRRLDEVSFYDLFFSVVERWVDLDPDLVERAQSFASRFGLSAVDALHVAAALSVGADELLTTEKPQKPIHRVKEVRVRSLYPGG